MYVRLFTCRLYSIFSLRFLSLLLSFLRFVSYFFFSSLTWEFEYLCPVLILFAFPFSICQSVCLWSLNFFLFSLLVCSVYLHFLICLNCFFVSCVRLSVLFLVLFLLLNSGLSTHLSESWENVLRGHCCIASHWIPLSEVMRKSSLTDVFMSFNFVFSFSYLILLIFVYPSAYSSLFLNYVAAFLSHLYHLTHR